MLFFVEYIIMFNKLICLTLINWFPMLSVTRDYTPESLEAMLNGSTTIPASSLFKTQISTLGTQSTSTELGVWWMLTGVPGESLKNSGNSTTG